MLSGTSRPSLDSVTKNVDTFCISRCNDFHIIIVYGYIWQESVKIFFTEYQNIAKCYLGREEFPLSAICRLKVFKYYVLDGNGRIFELSHG